MISVKTCPRCRVAKPRTEYGKNRSRHDGMSYACKLCTREQYAQWKAASPTAADRNRERLARLYHDEPDRYLNYRYSNRFGISLAEYDEMLKAQGGGCAICERLPDSGVRLAVDHDHTCCPGKKSCGGCVRGLLCANCNRAVGLLRDDPDTIRRASAYVERPTRLEIA